MYRYLPSHDLTGRVEWGRILQYKPSRPAGHLWPLRDFTGPRDRLRDATITGGVERNHLSEWRRVGEERCTGKMHKQQAEDIM